MIFKKKIDFYSTSDYGVERIHTKGKRIEVTDLKSELSEEALKEYKNTMPYVIMGTCTTK